MNPGFTFSYKYSSSLARNQDVPGPGSYFPALNERQRHTSPTRKITHETKEKSPSPRRVETWVGPGEYMPKPILEEGPKFSFGRAKKQQTVKQMETSGFIYAPETTPVIPKKVVTTFGSAPKTVRQRESENVEVGPGKYNLDVSFDVIAEGKPAVSFPKSIRSNSLANDVPTPGPGTYEQTFRGRNWMERGAHITNSKRTDIGGVPIAPGPGAYYLSKTTLVAGIKIPRAVRRMMEPTTALEGPGPAKYNLRKLEKSDRGIKIPLSQRQSPREARGAIPGPGQYETRMVETHSPEPAIGSGKRGEIFKVNDIPGPGKYAMLPPTNSNGPHITQARRSELINLKATFSPGPGSYL